VSPDRFETTVLSKIRGRKVAGRFYRTVLARYRDRLDDPIGSSRVDGRYHTTAEDQVLYLSDSPTLCMGEATRILSTVPLKEAAWHTGTFTVELTRALDLTSSQTLDRLGITVVDLVQPRPGGFRLTQALATAARGQGFEGLLVQTARPGLSGNNLVVFLEVVEKTGGTVEWVR